jgi:hypothetical protein
MKLLPAPAAAKFKHAIGDLMGHVRDRPTRLRAIGRDWGVELPIGEQIAAVRAYRSSWHVRIGTNCLSGGGLSQILEDDIIDLDACHDKSG